MPNSTIKPLCYLLRIDRGVSPEIPPVSIFQESWWLEAANPGAWREITLHDHGRLVARWPFSIYRRRGLRIGGMAPLTSTLGPWLAPLSGGEITRRKREIVLISKMTQQLPPFTFFRQILPASQTNLLPFQMNGFRIEVEQTFEIDTTVGVDGLWAGFQDNLRRKIRRSEREQAVAWDITPDEFLAIHHARMRLMHLKDRLDGAAFRRIYQACSARDACRIVGLRNDNGRATAALFVVHAGDRMHHFLQTLDPAISTAGAIEALTWSAIKLAHSLGLTYDLDGIPDAAAVSRLLRYGGHQKNRFIITRGRSTVLALRNFYKGMSYRFGRAKRFP